MYHKECSKNEEFVGNINHDRDLAYLHDVKYHVGMQAFDIHGCKIPQDYKRPLFISKDTFNIYDRIMVNLNK